jgi:tetratricopeptide (TPR) repeat protein
MKNLLVFGSLLIVTAFAAGSALSQHRRMASHETLADETQRDDYGIKPGTVRFPVSCNKDASRHAERGLALLHHMTYEGARDEFAAATKSDPDCAMGYWGQAMTFIHPLWSDPPTREDFEKGRALLKEARSRGKKTEREEAYIAAVEAYYKAGWNPNETANLASFEQGWEKAHEQSPDDLEAATFYALASLATNPTDKTYATQKRAGALLRKALEQVPDHPGGNHYLIHAYDYPPLAKEALEVARHYGEIAPAVPHALHMPTHIFTRLGFWEESIEMNKRSAAAAIRHPAGDKVSLHHPHAVDYLVYAYLQRAEDEKADQIAGLLAAMEGPFQIELAAPYTLAAVPARLALERQQWEKAATLEARKPSSFPWDKFPAMEAITHFARALGAARAGKPEAARRSIEKLETLRERAAATSQYWAKQIEIQRVTAEAWLAYQLGDKDDGLEIMRKAAALEASTEKHPVTPGETLPSQELLADMLLDMGRYKDASAAYKAALDRSPNRFNSLYGAGRAAELDENRVEAALYYRRLVEITAKESAAERSRLKYARAYLAAHGAKK